MPEFSPIPLSRDRTLPPADVRPAPEVEDHEDGFATRVPSAYDVGSNIANRLLWTGETRFTFKSALRPARRLRSKTAHGDFETKLEHSKKPPPEEDIGFDPDEENCMSNDSRCFDFWDNDFCNVCRYKV